MRDLQTYDFAGPTRVTSIKRRRFALLSRNARSSDEVAAGAWRSYINQTPHTAHVNHASRQRGAHTCAAYSPPVAAAPLSSSTQAAAATAGAQGRILTLPGRRRRWPVLRDAVKPRR